MHTDRIEQAAEEARARDAAALAVTGLVTPGVEYEDIPNWLLRSLTDEQREEAWEAYCLEHGIERTTPTMRAPARDIESRTKISLPSEEHPDLRAISKAEKDRVRITKMKVGISQKKAVASGETKAMPLTGKDALAKIRGKP